MTTKENYNDVIKDAFRAYDSMEESIKDHAKFLYERPRYKQIFNESTYKGQAQVLEDAGANVEDLTHIIPHQANIRIIEAAAKRLKVPMEKFFVNIESTGNTSAASIPIALDEMNRAGLLKNGDKIAMVGFGGGLTYGAAYLEWNA